MRTVLLHLERLRRNYEVAVHTYDAVSLLELSHTLRIWTELKASLTTCAPNFSSTLSFKTATPAKRVLKAARGHVFVFAYMPGGVRTYAGNGHVHSGPKIQPDGADFTAGISVKHSPPLLELKNYCYVQRAFDASLNKALQAECVTRCNFVQWLGAEVVRVSYVGENNKLAITAITREMIIKRVANTLDGSHASAGGGDGSKNAFDAPVHYLLRYEMGGLPLPYFILLKIAQDILDVAPKLLGVSPTTGAPGSKW